MPSIKSKIAETSRLEEFLTRFRSLDDTVARAGYDETPHTPEHNISYADVAYINNEGVGVTQRAFMDEAITLKQDLINQQSAIAVMNALYQGMPLEEGMEHIAEDMATTITEAIEEGNWTVTNNPTPLIDTGKLAANPISWTEEADT